MAQSDGVADDNDGGRGYRVGAGGTGDLRQPRDDDRLDIGRRGLNDGAWRVAGKASPPQPGGDFVQLGHRHIQHQRLAGAARARAISSPAVVLVGDTVGLRREIISGMAGWT